jgi:hypothetical protein
VKYQVLLKEKPIKTCVFLAFFIAECRCPIYLGVHPLLELFKFSLYGLLIAEFKIFFLDHLLGCTLLVFLKLL